LSRIIGTLVKLRRRGAFFNLSVNVSRLCAPAGTKEDAGIASAPRV